MNTGARKAIADFRFKLGELDGDPGKYSMQEIQTDYLDVLLPVVESYSSYRSLFPVFSSCMDNYLHVSTAVFMSLFEALLHSQNIEGLDLSSVRTRAPEESFEYIKRMGELWLSDHGTYRLSEFSEVPDFLSTSQARESISLLIDSLENDSLQSVWSKEMIEQHSQQLLLLRSLSRYIGEIPVFYFSSRMFFDRLATSEFFQLGRDLNEEIIGAAFKDGEVALGFLNAFSCYSRQGSLKVALLYANMSLLALTRSQKNPSERYVSEMFQEGIKCYRNAEVFGMVVQFYKAFKGKVKLSSYEARGSDLSYYSSLVMMLRKNLPSQLLDYLHKEREELFISGVNECLPWLALLFNVKRVYPEVDFSDAGLGFYLNTFKAIVPEEYYRDQLHIIEGDVGECKAGLKRSILKLNDTRYKNDLVIDNGPALTKASRMVKGCFEEQDVEGVMLSMMLKSDFSLLFEQKESASFRPIEIPNSELENFNSVYEDADVLSNLLSPCGTESFVWVPATEGKIFQMTLTSGKYEFLQQDGFNWKQFENLRRAEYFSQLRHVTLVETFCGNMERLKEDYLNEADEIRSNLKDISFGSDKSSRSMLLIKDMDLAALPHNLLLDQDGEFIHRYRPITNILSTEWYLSTREGKRISREYSKSIWIPTTAGDPTINRLHDFISDDLDEFRFDVHKGKNASLSEDLSIVCSHGDSNIAFNQVVKPGDGSANDLEEVVCDGEILILLVCHSGSYKQAKYANDVTSLVKKVILKGYRAVIAPFWSQHIEVVPIWLSAFMESFEGGKALDQAVYEANLAVYEKYPTPVAWACMHLYGAPNLVLEEKK